jgi:hypothetical protein
MISCHFNIGALSTPVHSCQIYLREWMSSWIYDCWDANWDLSFESLASSFAYSTSASMYCLLLLANLLIKEKHGKQVDWFFTLMVTIR